MWIDGIPRENAENGVVLTRLIKVVATGRESIAIERFLAAGQLDLHRRRIYSPKPISIGLFKSATVSFSIARTPPGPGTEGMLNRNMELIKVIGWVGTGPPL
jgi:hypothetical protein